MKKESQLSNQIKKLQYQLSYSQHINKQMSHYLAQLYRRTGTPVDKIPSINNIDANNVQILSGHSMQTHLQQLYYVQPLIMCYEESLYFLKEQLTDIRQHNDEIIEQVQNVTKQNQFLRKELNLKLSMLAKSDGLGIDAGFMKVQKQNLAQIKGVLQQKVEFLSKKVKNLQNQLDTNNRQKLKLPSSRDLESLKDSHKSQLKTLQTRLISMQSQLKRVKNQLQNEQALLKQQTQRKQTLDQNIALLKNELRLSKQNLQKFISTKQKTQQSLEGQLEITKEQLKVSCRKQQDLFNKLIALQSEIQDKTNRINNLSVQNAQLQSNNNNMLQMLQAYEKKVNDLNTKIKKLQSETKSYHQDYSEASKKAEVLQWKLSEKEEQIMRKEQQWRKQRQRVNKVWQQRIEAIRKGMNTAQHDNI